MINEGVYLDQGKLERRAETHYRPNANRMETNVSKPVKSVNVLSSGEELISDLEFIFR